ncbi:MAG: MoaD/ThiS family protein [Lutibacter sp.]|nr:MoaD/ThiS family protein [Lutibacter sp.]
MKIQLLFFGITTDLVGRNSQTYSIKEGTSIKDLKNILIADYPNLKNINEFAIAVNEEYANEVVIIKEGDVVAIIPPVSGG